MSSASSQVKDLGMEEFLSTGLRASAIGLRQFGLGRSPKAEARSPVLVVFFRNVITVPGRDLDDHFTRLGDLHLAPETRV